MHAIAIEEHGESELNAMRAAVGRCETCRHGVLLGFKGLGPRGTGLGIFGFPGCGHCPCNLPCARKCSS